MAIFDNPNYDFIKWRWHAIALSALIVLAGIGYAVTKGVPLGIDFSGGTIVVVKFEQPTSVDRVRAALASAMSGENVIQSYGEPSNHEVLIRLPQLVEETLDLLGPWIDDLLRDHRELGRFERRPPRWKYRRLTWGP